MVVLVFISLETNNQGRSYVLLKSIEEIGNGFPMLKTGPKTGKFENVKVQ